MAALSMWAALLFGEALAGAVVALMYSGGTFLESFAQGRARREMRDLLSRMPRAATRHHGGELEEVALAGESMPVWVDRGQEAMSGSTNAGEAFDLQVTRAAADSTFAGIVRLVEAAQASKAPMARLAARMAGSDV